MGLFYSLLFGGSLPHFFYEIMEQILTSQRGLKQMLFFTTERLLYTPMFQAVSLYSLAILEVWRQSSTTKHPPHRSFLWINKNFLFLSLLFFRCGFGRAKVTPPPWPICTRCTGPYWRRTGRICHCLCSSTSNLCRQWWVMFHARIITQFPSIQLYFSVLFCLFFWWSKMQLRVLVGNLIGFVWVIYLANKRRKLAEKQQRGKSTSE